MVFCTQYLQKDWHERVGSSVHADAIMDWIIQTTIWVETGNYNMCDHAALASAQQKGRRASAAPCHAIAGALPHDPRCWTTRMGGAHGFK